MRDPIPNPFDDCAGTIHTTLYSRWPFIKIRFEPSASTRSFVKFMATPDGYIHTTIDKKFPFVHFSWQSNDVKWREGFMTDKNASEQLCLLCNSVRPLNHDCSEIYPDF